MKPYQQRVIEEKRELDTKIKALNAFLDARPEKPGAISSHEFLRLRYQLALMKAYSNVLEERITEFTKHPPQGTTPKPQ